MSQVWPVMGLKLPQQLLGLLNHEDMSWEMQTATPRTEH